jgi:hypothetical protein
MTRVDTMVVETPIRHPSDSHLCEDVTQVLLQKTVNPVRG